MGKNSRNQEMASKKHTNAVFWKLIWQQICFRKSLSWPRI